MSAPTSWSSLRPIASRCPSIWRERGKPLAASCLGGRLKVIRIRRCDHQPIADEERRCFHGDGGVALETLKSAGQPIESAADCCLTAVVPVRGEERCKCDLGDEDIDWCFRLVSSVKVIPPSEEGWRHVQGNSYDVGARRPELGLIPQLRARSPRRSGSAPKRILLLFNGSPLGLTGQLRQWTSSRLVSLRAAATGTVEWSLTM
jgi:hypothetical protein